MIGLDFNTKINIISLVIASIVGLIGSIIGLYGVWLTKRFRRKGFEKKLVILEYSGLKTENMIVIELNVLNPNDQSDKSVICAWIEYKSQVYIFSLGSKTEIKRGTPTIIAIYNEANIKEVYDIIIGDNPCNICLMTGNFDVSKQICSFKNAPLRLTNNK